MRGSYPSVVAAVFVIAVAAQRFFAPPGGLGPPLGATGARRPQPSTPGRTWLNSAGGTQVGACSGRVSGDLDGPAIGRVHLAQHLSDDRARPNGSHEALRDVTHHRPPRTTPQSDSR